MAVKELFRAKKPYRPVVLKIFREMLGLLVKAAAAIFAIRVLGYRKIGNFLTALIMRLSGRDDWEWAQGIYFTYIRQNIEYWMFYAFAVFFLVFCWMLLNRFTRYFDVILSGVDQLVEGGDKPFSMPPELKFMEERLTEVRGRLQAAAKAEREAEKRKSDFLLSLAHDIRTPLTSVLGYLSLLEEGKAGEAEREKYLSITLRKARQMQELVEEFFEAARLTYAGVKLRLQPIDLSVLLLQLADEMLPQLTAAGRALRVTLPERIPVMADPDQLVRVFQNLLRNACAYGEEGTVLLTASAGKRQAAVSVSNPGTVPEEALSRLFERLYRRDPSRGSGGAGLGLTIAREIVRLHGGTVSARCADGRTVFTVTLPVGEAKGG